ncbi:uncharacterized protein K452DRAFT_223966 [Aplosporella prunicola CBS 121167]|uniref:Uncharacterized protein n=1 Tax=Aplosporella prunicola CBS 121167 TaxID=1176127 RepID=A0A6A6BN39_9PEZI|nr:uncharacterized protein K452DRAFT_223966 [Aplosporella prunicola CBS 121167]KAF2143971.1 hypothetical protein K452DRAFT_223966 [Aplosporella prunicola CBS 121167]
MLIYIPQSRAEWGFFLTAFVQALVVVGLGIFIHIRWQQWANPNFIQLQISYTAPVYLSLFMFGCLYQWLLAFDAIRSKHNIQLFAICVCNACLLIFTGLLYKEMRWVVPHATEQRDMYNKPLVKLDQDIWVEIGPCLLVCTIITGICTLAMWGFTYRLHKEFAWAIYKHVSADLHMRSRFLTYQIYLVLLKLVLYFFLSFVISYNLIDVHFSQPEYSLTMVLIPTSLLVLGFSVYYTRIENKLGMTVTMVFQLAGVAYLLSRIILLNGNSQRATSKGKDLMLLFAGVGMIFLIFTFIEACQCLYNFNKGLKPILLNRKPQALRRQSYTFQRLSLQPPSPINTPSQAYLLSPRRLSLD